MEMTVRNMAKIGERVIVNTLLWDGDFPGEIIDISGFGLCTVKLDRQETPIAGCVYYETPPECVYSSMWQICYPATERKTPKMWKILKSHEDYIALQSDDGWFRADLVHNGCAELYRVHNTPFTDDMTLEQADGESRMLLEHIHICDIDKLIKMLRELERVGIETFGGQFT